MAAELADIKAPKRISMNILIFLYMKDPRKFKCIRKYEEALKFEQVLVSFRNQKNILWANKHSISLVADRTLLYMRDLSEPLPPWSYLSSGPMKVRPRQAKTTPVETDNNIMLASCREVVACHKIFSTKYYVHWCVQCCKAMQQKNFTVVPAFTDILRTGSLDSR